MHTTLLERGIVRGRVALLLRSAEIQPLFEDLWFFHHFVNAQTLGARLNRNVQSLFSDVDKKYIYNEDSKVTQSLLKRQSLGAVN